MALRDWLMRWMRCRHRHTSRVWAVKQNGIHRAYYVTCLDCGKALPYKWEELGMIR